MSRRVGEQEGQYGEVEEDRSLEGFENVPLFTVLQYSDAVAMSTQKYQKFTLFGE